MPARILIVDDEPKIRMILSTILANEGYTVKTAENGEEGLAVVDAFDPQLILMDQNMPGMDGIQTMARMRDREPGRTIIILTAFGSIPLAVEAMKMGAYDYIAKPFDNEELLLVIRRALERSRLAEEVSSLRKQLSVQYRFENIIGVSPKMLRLFEQMRRVCDTGATVFIQGESGTGKELVAKAIHAYSTRKKKSFLAVNCAALPEPLLESEMFGHIKGAFTGASSDKKGLFESVEGGTIFLDEIGATPLSIQGKLLRVLQEKEVRRVGSNNNIPIDARVLAATNTRLETLLQDGKFREDLYYRLSVIPIEVKPLRERTEDILPLVYHLLRRETRENQQPPLIDPDVCAILEAYSWPGNVRELENTIKHASTFARDNRITRDVLPPRLANFVGTIATRSSSSEPLDVEKSKSLKAFLRSKEQDYLRQILDYTGGDKEKAAKALKISLATLYRKLPDSQE